MEKDRVICLLYCGGADGAALYVNRKRVTSLDSMVDLPTLLHDIFKEKKCIDTEVYSIDDDDITSEAFDAYYESDDENLTEAEEKAMIAGDGKEVDRLWKERSI